LKKYFILIVAALVGCGGGGDSKTTIAASVNVVDPAKGTGNPYYPMRENTQIVYQVSPVTSKWDPDSQRLDIVERGTLANQQTLQYSLYRCGDKPYFVTTYNTGALTASAPIPAGWKQSLLDSFFTSSTGISYLGEGLNAYGVVTPGEAKLSMSPVAGEIINEVSTVTSGCLKNDILSANYHWQYRTIEHLDTWRGYTDVWRTGLIEFDNGGKPAVYNYYFARGIGMVSFVWGNPLDTKTNTSPGYEYYAVPQ
jgi:hypothetical protein